MAVSYLNQNQAVNGAGQSVPNNVAVQGGSMPYQTFVSYMTGTGTLSATVQLEGSNDNVNWVNIGTALSATSTGPVGVVVNSTYAWFRAVVSSITGTSAEVTTTMSV